MSSHPFLSVRDYFCILHAPTRLHPTFICSLSYHILPGRTRKEGVSPICVPARLPFMHLYTSLVYPMIPMDYYVLTHSRNPTHYSHIAGLKSHFYAHIGALVSLFRLNVSFGCQCFCAEHSSTCCSSDCVVGKSYKFEVKHRIFSQSSD